MAADADSPNGELSKKITKATQSPDTDDGSTLASEEESEPTADAAPDGGDVNQAEDGDVVVDDGVDDGSANAASETPSSGVRLATIVGSVMVVALAATAGWLGFRAYQSHEAQAQRQLFLQVGRQCALNLTTIDWQHAEPDVQRILDLATGKFYDQFSQRKQPFIDVVKKAQSKSVGTVSEAGLESDTGDKAQVLVAVSIKTSNLGAEDQPSREWRMRISLEKFGDEVKVSNVSFVQ
ncbi:hypothetical protein [Mycobacterium palustre]|uniref:Mce protein n=1 Tax=Mycobacterium palustre TaxID=153971 RepID=A0A1X1ZJ29_9MYCO|nr:hypothetical protein [Mycobacterium palustre]MCV7102727.1 Mce protein [Mycobacterium palustre]ORW23322.1 hypothetical protein AWC19_11730 [Mycobacterium palustre]